MARWFKIKSRGSVDDRRAMRPMAIGGLSVTAILIMLALSFLGSGDFGTALKDVADTVLRQQLEQVQGPQGEDSGQFSGEDPYESFVSAVLGSANDAWKNIFSDIGKEYSEPRLVLFRQATESRCGIASSKVGPHYCSIDQTIYLDETFFDEMTRRLGARGGDVAEAYVIAHEVGHHVQNISGTLEKIGGGNESSIKLELQADCYAGIWANSIRDQEVFEAGEINEAMDAAASVGDDRIQEKIQGYANPETFTHGTSEERQRWFAKGYDEGSMDACDTFSEN